MNLGKSIFCKIRRQGDALNKPLLLLQALGNLAQGKERLLFFEEMEGQHSAAIRLFGVGAKNPHPSYAFWRLQNDGLWNVETSTAPVPRTSNTDPTAKELRRKKAKGGLSREIFKKLSGKPSLIKKEFDFLLNEYFPKELHACIRNFFCIDLDREAFRNSIADAYKGKCAISHFCPKIDGFFIGLTAVPIKRIELGGPLDVKNGLFLADHLAQLFMVGYFTVVLQGGNFRVLLSNKALRNSDFALRGGEPLNIPKNDSLAPNIDFLKWHKEKVFIR